MVNPRKNESKTTGSQAHSEAQKSLRTAGLSIREATETLVRERTEAGAAPAAAGAAVSGPDVHEITSRLMAKVDEAKRSRVDAVIRRASTVKPSTAASAAGKKGVLVGRPGGPVSIHVDEGADVEDELCVIAAPKPLQRSALAAAGNSSVPLTSPNNSTFVPSPAMADVSQSSTSGISPTSQHDAAGDTGVTERDRQLLEQVRKRHEMRRMRAVLEKETKDRSLSPTDSVKSFPPPPTDAPMLPSGHTHPLTPRSPLLSNPPPGLNGQHLSSSLTLQRAKTADFTSRISAACKDGDAARIMKLNSFDNATSKTVVTFGALAQSGAASSAAAKPGPSSST